MRIICVIVITKQEPWLFVVTTTVCDAVCNYLVSWPALELKLTTHLTFSDCISITLININAETKKS